MIKVNGIKLEIGHFPDGTILTKYEASFPERAKLQTHEIVWHFENNEEMVALMYITRHLQTHGVRNIELVMSYIPKRPPRQSEVRRGCVHAEVFCGVYQLPALLKRGCPRPSFVCF